MILITSAVADGTQTAFPFDFPFIVEDDIRVYVGNEPTRNWRREGGSVVLPSPPLAGTLVDIQRVTTNRQLVTFTGAAIQLNSDLVASFTQTLHIAEEAQAFLEGALLFSPSLNAYNAHGERIANVGYAIQDDDVATLLYLRTYLVTAGVLPADADAVAAALLGLQPVLVTAREDADDVRAKVALVALYVAAMSAALNALVGLADNPPPFGADLIARIDLALGGSAWRDIADDASTFLVYDADATWTKPNPTPYKYVLVETWGGGAAGSSFDKNTSKVETGFGAAPSQPGGGGGSFDKEIFSFAFLPATVDITIGLGGDPTGVKDGGDTTFGPYLTAYGGKASTTPLKGGQGARPAANNQPAIALPDGRFLGDGGDFAERSNYIPNALLASGGIFHGGGGGSGHGNNPNRNHFDPAFDGGSSENGGGGGGGGYTQRLTAGQDAPIIREIAGQYFIQVATVQIILTQGAPYTSGPFVGFPRQRYINASGYSVERPATLAAYNAALATGLYAGYGQEGDRYGRPKSNYVVVQFKSSGSTDYLLPGKGGKSLIGGRGGDGGDQGQPGKPGVAPGGGGGGAGTPKGAWYNNATIIPGGLGAKGRVKLSYF